MRHPRRRESRRWPAVALWSSCDPWAAARGPGGAQPSSPRGTDTRQGNAHACGGEHIRWWFADSSAKSTTKQARARAPMCARRRAQCGPRERPYRAAPLKQAWQIFQNRDAMGSAAPRPSTRTMVLCTGTRGSLVRCPLRQRRPVRAARSSALSSRFGARVGANSREFTKMSGAAAAHAATSVRRLHMCDEPRPSMPRQAGTTKAGDPRSYSQHSNGTAHRQELRVCCMQGYLSTLRF